MTLSPKATTEKNFKAKNEISGDIVEDTLENIFKGLEATLNEIDQNVERVDQKYKGIRKWKYFGENLKEIVKEKVEELESSVDKGKSGFSVDGKVEDLCESVEIEQECQYSPLRPKIENEIKEVEVSLVLNEKTMPNEEEKHKGKIISFRHTHQIAEIESKENIDSASDKFRTEKDINKDLLKLSSNFLTMCKSLKQNLSDIKNGYTSLAKSTFQGSDFILANSNIKTSKSYLSKNYSINLN
jgi:hypothetical protein